jgi:hypothetical protein
MMPSHIGTLLYRKINSQKGGGGKLWGSLLLLKEQCHEIFCYWFFSWIRFPPAPEYSIKTVSNFLENSRRYSQVKVHHRYRRHRWQICTGPAANFSTIFSSVVSTTPTANLPPVSTTPVANCHRYQGHRRQICHWCKWHRWQTMGAIIKLLTT